MANTSESQASLSLTIAREAIQVAEELDQIRTIYGEDCLTSVKRALHTMPEPDWHKVIDGALVGWESEHPRGSLGFTL
jgi:hypothetical protein